MGKRKDYDNILFDWRDLTREQKIQVYDQYRKTANRRIRRLRDYGYDVPVDTMDYLDRKDRKFFPKISKRDDEWQLNSALLEVENFLNLKSSTITGMNQIMDEVASRVEKRINEFRYEEDKINIMADKRIFYNFLHSKQFRQLRGKIDSDLLIEDFEAEMEKGNTFDRIIQHYEEYLNNEFITWEQMKERREKSFDADKLTWRKSKNL